jgi:hypothetical protein
MKSLGQIVRLQIQRGCLKRVENGRKTYDPSPILAVTQLTLTKSGACARLPDGSYLIDVHNAAHPTTRNNQGVNPLSFVFTSHYARMRQRFGEHLVTGCAGESILIETSEIVALGDVAGGVVIQTKQGPVTLGNVIVAEPCTSFSEFALQRASAPADQLKPALQFLAEGTRGYYCQLASNSPATIEVGDMVYAGAGAPVSGAPS